MRARPWVVVLLLGALAACRQQAQAPAAVVVPPAEARPAHMVPGVKWLPESPRYQQARRDSYPQGRDVVANLEFGRQRDSRRGLYRVRIEPLNPGARLGDFQSWKLHVDAADGRPVSGAVIHVKGGMPQHGHGLPTLPQVSAGRAPGEYRIDGLQFSMPGWWELSVYISSERQDDIVTFNLDANFLAAGTRRFP